MCGAKQIKTKALLPLINGWTRDKPKGSIDIQAFVFCVSFDIDSIDRERDVFVVVKGTLSRTKKKLKIMASADTAFPAQTTASGDSLSVCEVEAAQNFVSPPTPSSEASKSTCSAPPLEVEMDEDSPVASPVGGLTPTLSSLLTSGKLDAAPASDLRLSSAAARKIMFDQVKILFTCKCHFYFKT